MCATVSYANSLYDLDPHFMVVTQYTSSNTVFGGPVCTPYFVLYLPLTQHFNENNLWKAFRQKFDNDTFF